jgi:glycosyltransferase involved in cell wall biosynthesis
MLKVTQLKIAVYVLAYNEEVMLPHFIDHYQQFCDKVVVYDNMSTDNTKQLALDSGCEVVQWEADGGGLNDSHHVDIKAACFVDDATEYDWVITVDADEFYTHKAGINGLLSTLARYTEDGITVPRVSGYNMFSYDHDLTTPLSTIGLGVPSRSYSKQCLFKPTVRIAWTPGCHAMQANGADIVQSADSSVILKHYKYINYEWVLARCQSLAERLSAHNLARGYGSHYLWEPARWLEYFKRLEARAVPI